MKANYNLAIIGDLVTLVPYRKHHVERYHSWMSSNELLEATASEPLSLEEEYEMQRSWRDDEKKCTFIILRGGQKDEDVNFQDEGVRMLGDVNLFLNDYDDLLNAEIEIMIAESKARRKGFAKEALKLMMAYAFETLHLHRLYAKISVVNKASINLFKSLGYRETNYVEAFKEYEYAFDCRESSTLNHAAMKAVREVQASSICEEYANLPSTLNHWKNSDD